MDYTYLGYTQDRQLVKGRISAANQLAASEMLTKLGYRVLSLKPVTSFLPDLGKLFPARVSSAEMITFSRQLALLLESGVNIIQALELLQAQTTDKALRRVLIEVVSNLRAGSSLSTALAGHPHVFSPLYRRMIAVGEQTGNLETVLRSLADYAERESATIAKLKQALTYPAIVVTLAIAVGAVMVTVLLPPLIDMFAKLGGELPITTRMLLAGMGFLNQYGLHLLVAIIAIITLGFLFSRTPTGRYLRDLLMLKLPLLGRLNLLTELARCCRSLSLLFRAGLPMPEVMTLTAQSANNRVIARALGEVEQEMLRGQGLAAPMRRRPVFLPLMVEMTRVGEETGNLDETLVIVAENYEIEAERRRQTLLSLIEPAMTIMVGLGVGFLALSVFMPIYGSLKLVGG